MKPGPLIILSGPSGSGKTTVIERVLKTTDVPLHLSVSATTRATRPGEENGVHYYFWTPDQFERAVRAGAFLEWAEVHGQRYGTLRQEVEPFRHKGEGARAVRRQIPEAVLVFMRTSKFETYEQRLRQRATEDETRIQQRLATARRELDQAHDYDFEVINDDLNVAVKSFHAIIRPLFERNEHAG